MKLNDAGAATAIRPMIVKADEVHGLRDIQHVESVDEMTAQLLVPSRKRQPTVDVAATAHHTVSRMLSDFMKGSERSESGGSPVADSSRPEHDNRHR